MPSRASAATLPAQAGIRFRPRPMHPSGVERITLIEHLDGNIHAAVRHLWKLTGSRPTPGDIGDALFYVRREQRRQHIRHLHVPDAALDAADAFAAHEADVRVGQSVKVLAYANSDAESRHGRLHQADSILTAMQNDLLA
jgi:hypothetical protein